MTFLTFYLIAVGCAVPLMIFGTWLDMKKDPNETITVGNILFGIFLGFTPILNVLVSLFLLGWLIFDVAPKVVVFGAKGKGTVTRL